MKWWIKEVDLDGSYVIHSEKSRVPFGITCKRYASDKERFSYYDKGG